MLTVRASTLGALGALGALASPPALLAQANPVSDAVRASARASGTNLLAAAEAMPADRFGYRPTAAQMTFGELIVHIHGDNRVTCRAIGGIDPAAEPPPRPTDPKEELVAALRRSLAFCDAALARATDARLGDTVPYYGRGAARGRDGRHRDGLGEPLQPAGDLSPAERRAAADGAEALRGRAIAFAPPGTVERFVSKCPTEVIRACSLAVNSLEPLRLSSRRQMVARYTERLHSRRPRTRARLLACRLVAAR